MSFSVRLENGMSVHAEGRVYRAQDNNTFLDLLNNLWNHALKKSSGVRIRKVSVALSELGAVNNLQAELFASATDIEPTSRRKSEQLSRTMDEINQSFRRDSILIGMTPAQSRSSSRGSKIKYPRIPDVVEFLE